MLSTLSFAHSKSTLTRWRVLLLCVCAVAAGTWFFNAFDCTPLLPLCGTSGFSWTSSGQPYRMRVSSVERNRAAARGGMRTGDIIDLRDLTPFERLRLRENPLTLANERVDYVIRRDGIKQRVTLYGSHVSVWGGQAQLVGGIPLVVAWIGNVTTLWSVVFAVLIAFRKYESPRARLLAIVLLVPALQISLQFPGAILDGIATALGFIWWLTPMFFAMFCATFAKPLSPLRRRMTAFAYGSVLIAVFAALAWCAAIATLFPTEWSRWDHSPLWLTAQYAAAVANFAAVGCGVFAIIASAGYERQQAVWATVSVAFYWFVFGLIGFVGPLLPTTALTFTGYFVILTIAQITLPVGLTYAVLSRRFVDIGFVVNRAVVFGATTALLLGAFVLLEWALSGWISGASHSESVAANLAVALCIGVSMRFAHTRVERLVDAVLFRKRKESEAALRRFAHEATFITDFDILLDRAAQTLSRHSDASWISIFLVHAGMYQVVRGSPSAAISENDAAVVSMRAWHEPLDLGKCATVISGDLAFPMIVRNDLLGFLVCGPTRDGDAYAPDERAAIRDAAQGVAMTLDVLRANPQTVPASDVQMEILRELRALAAKLSPSPMKMENDVSHGAP